MRTKILRIVAICVGTFTLGVQAQLLVNQDTPANMISNILVGNGVNVSNISSSGLANQFGTFNGTNSNLGLGAGIVLSTAQLNPPNGLANGATLNPANPNLTITPDAQLSALIGNTNLYNRASIQFDFIPSGDTLKFDYVFASEEYNQYVNSNFNDVFGFFLTGPNPSGPAYNNTNVAIIPGSGGLPVSINNVNNGGPYGGCSFGPCNFCQYFFDNCNPTSVAFGGFTIGLRVAVPVTPCVPYTIRMAVADVGDNALNSAVFLRAGSFSSGLVSISSQVDYGSTDTLLYEGCSNATLSFFRSGDNSQSDTVFYTIGGTATPGADYPALPGFVVFAPGQDTVQVVISPTMDLLQEGNETITFTVQDTVCGQPFITTATLTLVDVQPLTVLTPDTNICRGQVINLSYGTNGGSGNFTTTWTFNGNPVAAPFFAQPPNNRTYVVSVYDDCLDTTISANLNVKVFPKPDITVPNYQTCTDEAVVLTPTPLLPNFNYNWSPAAQLDNPAVATPIFLASNTTGSPVNYGYQLSVDSAGVVCTRDSATVTVFPLPLAGLNGDTLTLCEDSILSIDANPGLGLYQWQNGPTTPSYVVNSPGWYFVQVTSNQGCESADSAFVVENLKPRFTVNDALICPGDTAELMVPDTLGAILWSNGATTPMIRIGADTVLLVTISNACGATVDTAEVTFKPEIPPFDLPNVFTPNGDQGNDVFEMPILAQAESYRWDVFTRWGTKLFTGVSAQDTWDGTTPLGAPVPEGTYYLIVTYVNCKGEETQKTGTINLFRQ